MYYVLFVFAMLTPVLMAAVLMVVFRESASSFVLWLIGGQMVFLCISAFLVDALLKNTFDENGLPIER